MSRRASFSVGLVLSPTPCRPGKGVTRSLKPAEAAWRFRGALGEGLLSGGSWGEESGWDGCDAGWEAGGWEGGLGPSSASLLGSRSIFCLSSTWSGPACSLGHTKRQSQWPPGSPPEEGKAAQPETQPTTPTLCGHVRPAILCEFCFSLRIWANTFTLLRLRTTGGYSQRSLGGPLQARAHSQSKGTWNSEQQSWMLLEGPLRLSSQGMDCKAAQNGADPLPRLGTHPSWPTGHTNNFHTMAGNPPGSDPTPTRQPNCTLLFYMKTQEKSSHEHAGGFKKYWMAGRIPTSEQQ